MKTDLNTPTQTVTKALSILELFTEQSPDWAPAEMAKALGLNQSTTHRLITTMESMGFLERHPASGRLRLGLRLVELGHGAVQQQELFRLTLPLMQDLTRATGLQSTVAVLYRGRALYLSRIDPPGAGLGGHSVGRTVPLHCTAVGMLLLSQLPPEEAAALLDTQELQSFTPGTVTGRERLMARLAAIRERGYASVMGEWIQGNGGMAAPIYNAAGSVVAALALSGPVDRFEGDAGTEELRHLSECATRASYLNGYTLAYA